MKITIYLGGDHATTVERVEGGYRLDSTDGQTAVENLGFVPSEPETITFEQLGRRLARAVAQAIGAAEAAEPQAADPTDEPFFD